MDIKGEALGSQATIKKRLIPSDGREDSLSPAKMKLLLLCLGLTLVRAQEGNSDVVRSNFDIPKVRAGEQIAGRFFTN